MDDNKKFEIEVLTRLTRIETMLRDFEGVEDKSNQAYNLSLDNKKRIDKLEDNNQWIFRTSIGAMIVALINIAMSIIRG